MDVESQSRTTFTMDEVAKLLKNKRVMLNTLKLNGFYLPKDSFMNMQFLKKFLVGKKRLLKIGNQTIFPDVPVIDELKAGPVWAQLKQDPEICLYFPDCVIKDSARTPPRRYMFHIFANVRREEFGKMLTDVSRLR